MFDHVSLLPAKLKLDEAVEILARHRPCDFQQACDLVERAIHDRSLRSIETFYADGTPMPADPSMWRDFEWATGIVWYEPSWSGSPTQLLPIVPLLNREEFFNLFGIGAAPSDEPSASRGGRPARHDWDAFWVEVCRIIHDEGVPTTKGEFANHMLDWFIGRGDSAIDRRTIEKKLSQLFRVLRPNHD